MINEYDLVFAKKALSKSVNKGCQGTVMLIYRDPKLAYEVEFIDKEGNTLDVLTVYPSDVEKL